MALLFSILLLSSWCTEVIGIHALFGAFLAGIVIPKNQEMQTRIISRISDLTLVMLLPLFFVYTGLRTQAGILNSGCFVDQLSVYPVMRRGRKIWRKCFGSPVLGQSWKDSLSIGALMNTRGLMELVVLNIGYDMGILSTEIFSTDGTDGIADHHDDQSIAGLDQSILQKQETELAFHEHPDSRIDFSLCCNICRPVLIFYFELNQGILIRIDHIEVFDHRSTGYPDTLL